MESFKSEKEGKLSKIACERYKDLSYSAFCKLLRKKDIKVNSKRVCKDVKLSVGDFVQLYFSTQKRHLRLVFLLNVSALNSSKLNRLSLS